VASKMSNHRRNQFREKRGTIIEGIPPIPCIFCDFMTSIEFDLEIHLYAEHRNELVRLPIGKGNIDFRIAYAINEGKKIREAMSNLTPKTRYSFGIYQYNNTNISVLPSYNQVNSGLDFILSHLDEPLFPRTVMTKELGRQIKVFDRQSTMDQFKKSNYYDCRINGYSNLLQQNESILFYNNEVRIAITIIVIDLDRKDFSDSNEKLDEISKKTVTKIKGTIGGCPTVLDTGNGYHIYQPIDGTILDDIDSELAEYAKFGKYYLPNKFLKFAGRYFTDGLCDPQHNPTVNSCLIRIPGTINSKCDKEVSLIKEWDYYRPHVRPILSAFKKYLSALGEAHRQSSCHEPIYPMNILSNNKYPSRQIQYIWIDTLLDIPLGDYRKYVVRLIIAPYLIVVKQRPYEECVKIMMDWLSRCNCVNQLRFHAEFAVKRSLESARRVGYKPIRLEKLQQEIPALYDMVMRRMQNGNL
jgi:hypothetical protein